MSDPTGRPPSSALPPGPVQPARFNPALRGMGLFYDGRSATGQTVQARLEGETLVLTAAPDAGTAEPRLPATEPLAAWPIEGLVVAGGSFASGDVRLRCAGHMGRLVLHGPDLLEALRIARPALAREAFYDQRPLRSVLGLFAVIMGAFGAIFFLVIPLLSGVIAQSLPDDWQNRLGARVEAARVIDYARALGRSRDQIRCAGPDVPRPAPGTKAAAARKAFDKIVARLRPHMAIDLDVRVTVVDVPVVNAYALPGGRIVVHKAAIEEARHPDEIAAVIAHEMRHLEARHPSRTIIERGATALLLNFLFGGVGERPVEFLIGRTLISTRHSRAHERDADEGAIRIMEAAGLDPRALASFLERAAKGADGQTISWLMTHPASRDRAETVRAKSAPLGEVPPAPVLTPDEFRDLKWICNRNWPRAPQRKARSEWDI